MKPHAVIVGAGPVGAVAALLLAKRDVAVTLVERSREPTTLSQASTFHPSTLDLLQTLGIDLAVEPAAITVSSLQWRDNRGEIRAELDYRLLADLTDHPFRIHLEQQTLLDRTSELIAAQPTIDFRLMVTAVDLDPGRPSVTLMTNDGEYQTITADAIIGCDGSNSVIRQSAGVQLTIRSYPTGALRAHARADLGALLPAGAPRPLSGLCYFRGDDDGLSALRMNSATALVVRSTHSQPDAVRVADAVANATPWGADDLAIDRIDSFQLGRGVVDSYLSGLGPVIVIGDAAHVTSTAGGLNMNSGIHDAFAVMPALADWLHGRLDTSVIARIAEARRRYLLEQVIPRTERRVRGLQDGERCSLTTHLDDIARLAEDRGAARQFLIEASLLDTPLRDRPDDTPRTPTPDGGNVMKIWLQKHIVNGRLPLLDDWYQQHISEVVDPGTEVSIHTLPRRTYATDTPYDYVQYGVVALRFSQYFAETAAQAERDGYDAWVIAAGQDPGTVRGAQHGNHPSAGPRQNVI